MALIGEQGGKLENESTASGLDIKGVFRSNADAMAAGLAEGDAYLLEKNGDFVLSSVKERFLGLTVVIPAEDKTATFELTYPDSMHVDWGDGNTQFVSGSGIHNPSHTYSNAGTYQIKLKGKFLTQGSEFIGLNFYGLGPKLTATTAIEGIEGIKYLGSLFQETSITAIPENLFYAVPELEGVTAAFQGTNIGSIPENLFSRNPKISDFERAFYLCPNITQVPEFLFFKNPMAKSFSGTFRETGLTSIPKNIFSFNPIIDNLSYTFCFDIELAGPTPEFWNMYPGVNGENCFLDCTGLSNYADIPAGWK